MCTEKCEHGPNLQQI